MFSSESAELGLLKIADGGRYSAGDIKAALEACAGDQVKALKMLRGDVSAGASGGGPAPGPIPKQGYMFKKGGMRWQKRWFELHSAAKEGEKPLLKYFKERGDDEVRGELPLDTHTTVANLASKTGGFQIICTGGRAMKVAADSDDEARLWKAQINQAIREASSIHAVTVGGQVYEIDRRYVPKRRIGSGAYGTVISAVDEQSGNQVAIKKVKDAFDDLIDAKRILREVRLMRAFSHPNILGLYDLIRPSSLEHFEDVYIISEKKSSDMQRIIFSDTPLSEDQQQWIMYQCLCGIKYMHSAGVLHRDLKPSNLLVDTETCDVQICDFGLSRGDITEEEGEKKEQTEYVVTRWYRAPEIMLGYSTYDYAIDVWSLGCIFGEILGREALLPGGDYIEQLKLIVNLVGSPTEGDLWYVSNRNARDFMMRLPKTNGQDFKVKFPSASDDAIDLLGKMLTMDPAKRLRVDEAITHQYQLPVREAERLEFNAREHTEVSDIESMELTKENLQRMLFEEIRLFHEERGAVQQVPSGLAQPSGMSLSER